MTTTNTRIIAVTAFVIIIFSCLPAGAGSVTLPATGQTLCYDQAGTVINCTGTMQDGAKRMGASWPNPRFNDNGTGTFTDNLTGLVWLSDNSCLKTIFAGGAITTFLEAIDAVTNLSDGQCGLIDGSVKGAWRIPNVNEALSVYDNAQMKIAAEAPFKNTSYTAMLSSTTSQKTPGNFFFVYTDGSVITGQKYSIYNNSGYYIYSLFAVRNP